ncbi:mechanosensitive ion channel family protein, partial [Tritonibacter sp. SIMBA_163]
LRLAEADGRVLSNPEPWVRVTNLGDSSVDISTRLWCTAGDYWELRWAMIQGVKEAFDAEGISIPYPHRVEIQKEG